MNDKGLYNKYFKIKRVDDSEGKHDDCEYFVLDLTHDPYARMAARTYAMVCRTEYPELSKDLLKIANSLNVEVE